MDETTRYQRLLERFRNGDLDRRTFLALIGGASLSAGLVGGPLKGLQRQALAATPESVRFDGWGGVVSEAFRKHAFDPYTEKTGITVIDGTFASGDEYLNRVKAGQEGEYNIFHASGVFDYARYVNLGYDVVLNEANIPNLKYVMTALMSPFRNVTGGKLSAVPYDYGTTGLAYNTEQISKEEMEEKGAKILVDPKYKGKIGGWGDWRTRIWYGALATDQNPNDINDMDAVWDAIRAHRDLVLKYWGSGYYDAPNSYAWQECLMVLKGSPLEACEELLNFMLEPDVSIAVAEGQNYPPALDPTKVELGDKIPTLPAFDPTGKLANLTFASPAYWNGNEAEWSKTFGRVQKGY